jgi:hypothetical protein
VKEGGRYRVFTFAGALPNKVLAAKISRVAISDDISITCHRMDALRDMPHDLADFLPELRQVFVPSDQQTIFQQKLPHKLQVEEFMQEWLTDEDAATSLRRISDAEPVEVLSDTFQPLLSH